MIKSVVEAQYIHTNGCFERSSISIVDFSNARMRSEWKKLEIYKLNIFYMNNYLN